MNDCPDEDSLARFIEGNAGRDGEAVVRAHIDVCGRCRRVVAAVGAGSGSLPLADPAPPTRAAGREVIGIGSVIDGKYRLARLIGKGGMGDVFAALHLELDQTVAVKVMHRAMLRDTDAVRRFLREGRAAARLKSDHAVRIHDVGRLPSGVPYLVMECLEGEDLERVRLRGVLSPDAVVDYVGQALDALAEAHETGLVHRDIKPQNLFLTRLPDGRTRVKVLDFGLAKELEMLDRDVSRLTSDNMILGSPHFMSPEQIQAPMDVDARTDIWSLGATMFMLLTGRAPYTSSTVHGLLARILVDPPPKACELRAEIPVALSQVIERCLAKDVLERFQNVAELAVTLRTSARVSVVPSTAPESEEPPTVDGAFFPTLVDAPLPVVHPGERVEETLPLVIPPTTHLQDTVAGTIAQRRLQRRWAIAAAVGALAACVLVGGVFALRHLRGAPKAAAPVASVEAAPTAVSLPPFLPPEPSAEPASPVTSSKPATDVRPTPILTSKKRPVPVPKDPYTWGE